MMYEELSRLRLSRRWNQARLAREIGVSQGYVSKLLAGDHRGGVEVRDRIAALVASAEEEASDEDLMKRVAEAARASPAFRKLLASSLALFKDIPKS